MTVTHQAHENALNLLNFIDASPSPWHAVATIETHLKAHDFRHLDESERWSLEPGGRYYVIRGDSSIISFVLGQQAIADSGFRIIAAHTDSPGLRLKPCAPHAAENMTRLGVEVYGGPILATFADRDLSLAGRVSVRRDKEIQSKLIRFEQSLIRLPNLAIHMNRNVNEEGLKLNKQTELPLLLANLSSSLPPREHFLALLANETGLDPANILNWELNVYDTQKGAFWGPDNEFIANSQLDNLASCHAGLNALVATSAPHPTCVCAFFDHEEIGSESAKGADGSFLSDVTERIARTTGLQWLDYKQGLARSFFISADMAHAYQPNFPSAYEPLHAIRVNGGPVIKTNVNQRYATDSVSEAYFIHLCETARIPFQQYAHRSDLGCGSTIGPMISSRLGVRTVDVGNPMWAMHSLRESAGVFDHTAMIQVLSLFFASN